MVSSLSRASMVSSLSRAVSSVSRSTASRASTVRTSTVSRLRVLPPHSMTSRVSVPSSLVSLRATSLDTNSNNVRRLVAIARRASCVFRQADNGAGAATLG